MLPTVMIDNSFDDDNTDDVELLSSVLQLEEVFRDIEPIYQLEVIDNEEPDGEDNGDLGYDSDTPLSKVQVVLNKGITVLRHQYYHHQMNCRS